jgi:hypothetical protein
MGLEGDRIRSSELRLDGYDDDGVIYPHRTCEVPTLRGTDMMALEALRRYRDDHNVGIALLGGAIVADDNKIVAAGLPGIRRMVHPSPDRKIKQLVVVKMDESMGLSSLLRSDKTLATIDLEPFGQVLVFAARKENARGLYESVNKVTHPTACLVDGNDKECVLINHVAAPQEYLTRIAYCRSVLGHGVNVDQLRAMVIDCRAFRPFASFIPKELTGEAYERAYNSEHLDMLMQVFGRITRGEEGKTGVVILLHADDLLLHTMKASDTINQGCELPPIWAECDDMDVVMDLAKKWLAATGVDWPSGSGKSRRKRRVRKQLGRKKSDLAILKKSARLAKEAGRSWRQFARQFNLDRRDANEKDEIRKAYDGTT